MNKCLTNTLMRYTFGLLSTAATNLAWAQGTITYGPDANLAVPALSGWLLVVLGLLFGVIAFRVMRSRNMGTPLAVLVALAVTGAGVTTGTRLIADSEAAAMYIALDVPSGSTRPLEEGDRIYQNDTNVPQRIIDINLDPGCSTSASSYNPGIPNCKEGRLLGQQGSPTDTCALNVNCDI